MTHLPETTLRAVGLLAALVLPLTLGACAEDEETSVETAATSTEVYTVRGQFLGFGPDSLTAAVRHEAIPNVMRAMTMSFSVGKDVPSSLTDGDKIRFVLRPGGGQGMTFSNVEVLPDTTMLDFSAGVPDSGQVR